MSEVAALTRRRAHDRCEYCLLPQSAFKRTFHIEHVVARQHGGDSDIDNLALACWQCNLKKGPNLSGIDPETGQLTPLFHPRHDDWAAHFRIQVHAPLQRVEIRGLTPLGRATVNVLGMNGEMRQMLRYELWREGLYETQST